MTSLKKIIIAFVLAAVAFGVLTVSARQVHAQSTIPVILSFDWAACDAYMLDKKGKWDFKVKAERKSERYLVRKKLILKFDAGYYGGGSEPAQGYLVVLTDTKPREIVYYWPLEINEDWTFDVEFKTEYGPVRVECHL